MKLFRYKRDTYSICDDEGMITENPEAKIELDEFTVFKETDCYYYVRAGVKVKKCMKGAKNTFAYADLEEAKVNFLKRCQSARGYAKRDVVTATLFLRKARELNDLPEKTDLDNAYLTIYSKCDVLDKLHLCNSIEEAVKIFSFSINANTINKKS